MTDTIPEMIEKVLMHKNMTEELRARLVPSCIHYQERGWWSLVAGSTSSRTKEPWNELGRDETDAFCLRCEDWLWDECGEVGLSKSDNHYWLYKPPANHDDLSLPFVSFDALFPTKNLARLSAMLAALDAKGAE